MKTYRVIIEPEAAEDLRAIYDFIAQNDMPQKARRFMQKLQEAILSLSSFPHRFRKSIYIEAEEEARDMIVHGYTVCYVIREDHVHILTVFRQRAF